MLIKSLQYVAEDLANDEVKIKSFIKITTQIIKGSFIPSPQNSINEQVSILLNSMGWKNALIKLKSGDQVEIVLGSNRFLDQDSDSVSGLTNLVKAIGNAAGAHILDRDVDTLVNIDIHAGPTYTLDIQALKSITATQKPEKVPDNSSLRPFTISTEDGKTKNELAKQTVIETPIIPISTSYETDQIFLPVLSNKLPLSRLHRILKDVLEEYCQSWFGTNPIADVEIEDERINLINLINFLIEKAFESDQSRVDLGSQVGNYFAHAIVSNFNSEKTLLGQEIIDGSTVGSIIRDIKARSLCSLKDTACENKIGGEHREFCDFVMGLWQGMLGQLTNKQYRFSGFYPAGKRDPYCLMEFEVNQK